MQECNNQIHSKTRGAMSLFASVEHDNVYFKILHKL